MEAFLRRCGTAVHLGLTFEHEPPPHKHVACGFYDGQQPVFSSSLSTPPSLHPSLSPPLPLSRTGQVPGGRKSFPPFAAGALGSAAGLADWLRVLALAYHRLEGCGASSHVAAA